MLGLTGASGAPYAARVLRALVASGADVGVVVSRAGAQVIALELYGDRGKPTRAAIGCQGLALNHSVEVVLTVLFTGTEVRPPLARDHYAR